MIILHDQSRQQMTLHFQLSLQCNVSPITGFVRHTAGCMPDEARDGAAKKGHCEVARYLIEELKLDPQNRDKVCGVPGEEEVCPCKVQDVCMCASCSYV